MSPTQRTLAMLRKGGSIAGIVERWNVHARVRQDLFGFCDIVEFHPQIKGVRAIQCTTTSNIASRVKKILAEPRAKAWLEADQRIAVIGWSKRGPRGKRKLWEPTIRVVTLSDFAWEEHEDSVKLILEHPASKGKIYDHGQGAKNVPTSGAGSAKGNATPQSSARAHGKGNQRP